MAGPGAASVVDLTWDTDGTDDTDDLKIVGAFPTSPVPTIHPTRNHSPVQEEPQETWTADQCLQAILAVIPDIQVDHTLELIKQRGAKCSNDCDALIGTILDEGIYPKEQRKRKLSLSAEGDDRETRKFARDDRAGEIKNEFYPIFA